ncbi:hypothetical protein TNCT_649781 [Trichonephila clavata]|uniref:Uncharacterized protein n=1 Tax=Trichonephila clavata TaxID=2740835 RepID=A0A8X6KY85_TRICU|nr:hypothetical protein TNCT_649781 [Trichonephila clavata]
MLTKIKFQEKRKKTTLDLQYLKNEFSWFNTINPFDSKRTKQNITGFDFIAGSHAAIYRLLGELMPGKVKKWIGTAFSSLDTGHCRARCHYAKQMFLFSSQVYSAPGKDEPGGEESQSCFLLAME